MKKQSSLIILFVPLFVVSALAQTGSKTPIDTLYERISQLEQSIRDQKESQRLAVAQIQQNTNQAISEQFKNASQALQTGLETGSAIELIIPETLRLIETKALT